MGYNIYKVPYKCDCGIDWGSCGADCAVILVLNRTVDVYHLFHTNGHVFGDKTESTTRNVTLNSFGDNYFIALSKVLEMKCENRETLTEQELEVIFNRDKW